MPDVTPAEMIAEIDRTIKAIVAGKIASRTIAGKAYTMLNIRELRELRAEYVALQTAEDRTNDGPMVVEMGGTC